MKLIDKDALVAELKRLQDALQDPAMNRESMQDYAHGGNKIINEIRSFLDAIEAKEVDLDFEQELYKAFGQVADFTLGMRIAKHFFELGHQASNPLTWEDIKTIDKLLNQCVDYSKLSLDRRPNMNRSLSEKMTAR